MWAFCRFWQMTPAEYRALTFADVESGWRFMEDELRRRKKAQRSR